MEGRVAARECELVRAQIGRVPRQPWRVAVRCPHGHPRVIASPSRLAGGTPFPTTFWLTCPLLVDAVGREESAGGVAQWEARLHAEPALTARAREAEEAYREARAAESGGVDACGDAGIAGVRRQGAVKCLHARVAAYLAGTGDPVGEGVASGMPRACDDERCARLARTVEGA
jgi:uncharacterized protein